MPRFDDDYDDYRPPRRPSRRRDSDDDDYDDRDEDRPSSRRRYRDADDEDDRPRRRYRDEEDENIDDHPRGRGRRRFDIDDDEEERRPAKKKNIGVLAGVMGGIAGFLAVSNMKDNRPDPAPPPPVIAPWGNIANPNGPAGPADFAKDPIAISNLRLEANAEAGKSPDLVFDYDSSEPLNTPLCVVAIIPGVVGQNVVNIEPLTQKRDKIRLSTTDIKVVEFKAGITVFLARRPDKGVMFPQPISNMMMLHVNHLRK